MLNWHVREARREKADGVVNVARQNGRHGCSLRFYPAECRPRFPGPLAFIHNVPSRVQLRKARDSGMYAPSRHTTNNSTSASLPLSVSISLFYRSTVSYTSIAIVPCIINHNQRFAFIYLSSCVFGIRWKLLFFCDLNCSDIIITHYGLAKNLIT